MSMRVRLLYTGRQLTCLYSYVTTSLPISFPPCAGPSEGGEARMAESSTGRTDATFAEYVCMRI